MAVLLDEKIEADRARLRTFRPDAMAGGLLRILRHQGLELRFRPLVVGKGGTAGAEEAGKLRPRIGLAHVDDADSLGPRPRRLDAIGARELD